MPTSGKTVIIEDFQESVLSRTNTPPGSPTIGDRYLIHTTPTGVWVGKANQIVEFVEGIWEYTAPSAGMRVWVEDAGFKYYYTGTLWLDDRFYTRDLLEDLVTTDRLSLDAIQETIDLKIFTAIEDTKLSNINLGATADTDDEIVALVETANPKLTADAIQDGITNKAFTAIEDTKLGNINLGATADTDDEIVALVEAANPKLTADAIQDGTTNKAFTAIEETKLSNINLGATADTDNEIVALVETANPKLTADAIQDGTTNKVLTATQQGYIPSVTEKEALAGSHGTPGSANKYVTETDPKIPVSQTFNIPISSTESAELITLQTDRDFSVDAGNWTGTNWSVVAEKWEHTAGANATTLGAYPAEIGKTYQVALTVVTTTLGTLTIAYGGVSGGVVGQATGTLTTLTLLVKATTTGFLVITPNAAWVGNIDDISIKEVTESTPQQVILSPLSSEAIHVYPHGSTALGIGVNCLKHLTTATNTLAIGLNCLEKSNADGNIALGINCLRNLRNGINNYASGVDSLISLVSGIDNHADGFYALRSLISGNSNHAIGYWALRSLTSGSSNIAIGPQTLESLISGNNNHAIGYFALRALTSGNNNHASGFDALRSLISGSNNHASGFYALRNLTTGSNNHASGDLAGRFLATGTTAHTICNNSTFIGYNTKALADNQTNQIVIGYEATGAGSNTVTIGNTDIIETVLRGTITNASIVNQIEAEIIQDLATSTTLAFAVPVNAKIIDFKFRVDVEVTSPDAATDWKATLAGGSTESIVTDQALIQNTKPLWSGLVITTDATNLVIASDTGTVNGGTVRATVRYLHGFSAYDDIV